MLLLYQKCTRGFKVYFKAHITQSNMISNSICSVVMVIVYQKCTRGINTCINTQVMGILSKILISAILITAGSCDSLRADISDWEKEEKLLYGTFMTLQVMDTLQTRNMIQCQRNYTCPHLQEANPLIGPYPSNKQLVVHKFMANVLIYDLLDRRTEGRGRRLALYGLILISATTVKSNSDNGLSFSIRF